MLDMKKGFTLIELMVVVGIIGIIASFALPAYQDYVKRTRVIEGINLISGIKADVLVYVSVNGEYPSSFSDIGLAANAGGPPNYQEYREMASPLRHLQMSPMDDNNGLRFTLYYNETVASKPGTNDSLYIYSQLKDGVFQWKCAIDEMKNTSLPERIVPIECHEKIPY